MLNKEIQQAKDKENVYLEPSQKRICKAQGERLCADCCYCKIPWVFQRLNTRNCWVCHGNFM